jgi:hypothetical protein
MNYVLATVTALAVLGLVAGTASRVEPHRNQRGPLVFDNKLACDLGVGDLDRMLGEPTKCRR